MTFNIKHSTFNIPRSLVLLLLFLFAAPAAFA
jgi:hypothetical protein